MDINKTLSFIEENIQQPLWGNWYIKEKIGSGSFSAVYRVEAKRLNRTDKSALKIEPITAGESLFMDEERKRSSIERKKLLVENESTIMYKLKRCPYVVAYEDEDMQELVINGKFEGYYFLIRMELLTSVSDLIHDKKMDFSESNILKLSRHIAKGIKATHDIGIIHRDIKPSNFFVSDDGIYKLGDFNVSKLSDTARTFAGTDGYVAPEIYRAKSDVNECYTKQADIYSFGICLYQFMNDLYLPFEENLVTDDAISKRMKGDKLPNPKNASEEFARVILKACAFDATDRYASMDEMLDDLNKIKAVLPNVAVGTNQNARVIENAESDIIYKTVRADDILLNGSLTGNAKISENDSNMNNRPHEQALIPHTVDNVPVEVEATAKNPQNLLMGEIASQEINKIESQMTEAPKEKSEDKITAVFAGWKHTVGIKSSGKAIAVGDDKSKQCDVGVWSNIVSVSAGLNRTLGLKSDGTVCDTLGTNAFVNWNNIKQILAGDTHAVGLRSDGTVVAVGENGSGQCNVNNWNNIVAIAIGSEHTVGLMSNGKAVAVGYNRNGECNVEGWSDIVAISANAYYTVGLKSNGTVVALGLSSAIQSEIQKWNNIIAVSAGAHHTVGLKSDKTVVAVGGNGYGECEVSQWSDIEAISAGSWHTVGLKSDGTVVAVGNNRNGQCNCTWWNKLD